eukprot:scaffold25243_cov18-Tisochrysis_lutea.AAC.5
MDAALYTCIGMIGLSWLFVLLFVPETSPRCLHERRQQEEDRSRRREQKAKDVNRFVGMGVRVSQWEEIQLGRGTGVHCDTEVQGYSWRERHHARLWRVIHYSSVVPQCLPVCHPMSAWDQQHKCSISQSKNLPHPTYLAKSTRVRGIKLQAMAEAHACTRRSAVISALSWTKLEPAAAVAALEPAAPPPCDVSVNSHGKSQRVGSLGGSSFGRSGREEDLEAPLLLNNYEGSMEESGVVDAAEEGLGVDAGLGSDKAGVHVAGGPCQEQDVEGRGGEGCGPHPPANGGPGEEGRHGSGGSGGTSAAPSGGGKKGCGRGGRGSTMLAGFRLIWHSTFYRKLLL